VTIINDASSSVNKLKASLNDAARGIIYDRHKFMTQATDQIDGGFIFLWQIIKTLTGNTYILPNS
jgi:hypothetical protein